MISLILVSFFNDRLSSQVQHSSKATEIISNPSQFLNGKELYFELINLYLNKFSLETETVDDQKNRKTILLL